MRSRPGQSSTMPQQVQCPVTQRTHPLPPLFALCPRPPGPGSPARAPRLRPTQGGGGGFARRAPGTCPARYFCINYPDISTATVTFPVPFLVGDMDGPLSSWGCGLADRLNPFNQCPHFLFCMTHFTDSMPISSIGGAWSADLWNSKCASHVYKGNAKSVNWGSVSKVAQKDARRADAPPPPPPAAINATHHPSGRCSLRSKHPFLSFWGQAMVSWRSPLTRWHPRKLLESKFRAVHCYGDGVTSPLINTEDFNN